MLCISKNCKNNKIKLKQAKTIPEKIDKGFEYIKCACKNCNCPIEICKILNKSKLIEKFKKNPKKYYNIVKPLV